MRVALIDSDIVAYKVAAASEEKLDFGTFQHKSVDKARAWKMADELVATYAKAVRADAVVVCLSDPDENWRKQLEPTYKARRKGVEKPELLMLTKEYLHSEYRSYIRPRLEADDVMGILATRPELLGKNVSSVVLVSEDKDMRTLPCALYNPGRPALGTIDVSPTEAKQFHLWQTIVGDTTDGYPGCPGLGEESEFAKDAVLIDDPEEMWDNVLLAYASKGLTEDDAIHQARLARILHCHDYNFDTKGIRLWNPTCLYW